MLLYGLTRMVYRGNCLQEYCGVVAYPSVQALREFSHDDGFLAIRALRDDSTRNYVLNAIESFDTMDDATKYLDEKAGEPRAQ